MEIHFTLLSFILLFAWLGAAIFDVQCAVFKIIVIFVCLKFSFEKRRKKLVSANSNVISIMHNMPYPAHAEEHISTPKKNG